MKTKIVGVLADPARGFAVLASGLFVLFLGKADL